MLSDEQDSCKWLANKTGVFFVQSIYLTLKSAQVKWSRRKMWAVRVPLKVKVFLWLTTHKSILTKDVMIRRGWTGDDNKCRFYGEEEITVRLFFRCALARFVWGVARCTADRATAPSMFDDINDSIMGFPSKDRVLISVGVAAVLWSLWKTRNAACFDHVYPHDPTKVIY